MSMRQFRALRSDHPLRLGIVYLHDFSDGWPIDISIIECIEATGRILDAGTAARQAQPTGPEFGAMSILNSKTDSACARRRSSRREARGPCGRLRSERASREGKQ